MCMCGCVYICMWVHECVGVCCILHLLRFVLLLLRLEHYDDAGPDKAQQMLAS